MNYPGLLFPGQGSQYVGMGADLYESFSSARTVYDRAEDILELPIKRLSFEGPEEELRKTCYTQPAILTHSLAALSVLNSEIGESKFEVALTAGHSLGEYSALYAAGCFEFETVLKLVRCRAELMFQEGKKRPGAMAAIIGLNQEVVKSVCVEAGGVVVPANYNEPKQTVIAGEPDAVKRAMEMAKAKGALKVVSLPVSGAFHSPLLTESARKFADYIRKFEIYPPRCPVIMNVTGTITQDAREVRANLEKQLISPVQWVLTIQSAREIGCLRFLEVGPGQVLSGLVRRIDRELSVSPAGKATELKALMEGV